MIPVLVIPTLNRVDMLEKCIRSIDHEVALLVVIDNSGGLTQYRREWFSPLIKKSVFIGHPNAGVAASWNEAIKLFPADYWVFSNDDIEFRPGSLAEFEKAIDANKDSAAAIVANCGASLWAVTHRGLLKVGLFDENFYPAYLEDFDWFHRVKLAGEHILQAPGVLVNHHGSQTVKGGRQYQKENDRTFANNSEYYRQKWGGHWKHETFSRPFNDPQWPLDVWRFEPGMRKINQWKV